MKGEAKRLDGLTRELDRRRLSESVSSALVELGEPAFTRLIEQVRAHAYSDRQAANAVTVLLRMGGGPLRGRRRDVARLLVQVMVDEEAGIELRSTAVWAGMILCTIADGTADEDLVQEHQNLCNAMRAAIRRGVDLGPSTSNLIDFARKHLEGDPELLAMIIPR